MKWLDDRFNRTMLCLPGVSFNDAPPKIRGRMYLRLDDDKSRIRFGNNVRINSGIAANPAGGTRMIMVALDGAEIIVGDHTGMSNATIIAAASIRIGQHVYLGAGCTLYDTDFHSVHHTDRINGNSNIKTAPVVVGDRVFVGAHAIVLKGVTIGDDAVIGAGSVVARNVPAGEIWAGNPAKFIRKLES